jgi:hypothetical protein
MRRRVHRRQRPAQLGAAGHAHTLAQALIATL